MVSPVPAIRSGTANRERIDMPLRAEKQAQDDQDGAEKRAAASSASALQEGAVLMRTPAPLPASSSSPQVPSQPPFSYKRRIYIYGTLAAWILLSISLIFINKQLLGFYACPFPFLLAFLHMATGGAVANWIVRRRQTSEPQQRHHHQQQHQRQPRHQDDPEAPTSAAKSGSLGPVAASPLLVANAEEPRTVNAGATRDGIKSRIHSDYNLVAAFLAAALIFANGGFMYLSVPMIQMLKAASPAVTFLSGLALGAERFSCVQGLNVIVICAGVFCSAYASADVHPWGVVLQLAAIVSDSLRCSLLQRTMALTGVSMDPMAALASFAPRAAAMLALPVILIESPAIVERSGCLFASIPLLAASCVVACLLNVSVCALIGATSALTTSISGVLKDLICILLALRMHHVNVKPMQWVGYATSMAGLAWHHYRHIFLPPQLPSPSPPPSKL